MIDAYHCKTNILFDSLELLNIHLFTYVNYQIIMILIVLVLRQ